jgi:nicotinate phosphoribosyltransferase
VVGGPGHGPNVTSDTLPPVPGGLLTDLYELNMAASYLRRGMRGPATFSLFVRHLPPNRGFLVAAGLEDAMAFLETFGFEDADLAYLGDVLGFDDRDLEGFRGLRFTGDVWAIPEGRLVVADEPLLEVTASLPEAQLVETFLLNQLTFQTTLASKAARCVLAARGRDVVDFAFRRTHGVDAAMAVARTSAMAGFTATSNVEAARRFGLHATGTMAHSFIEAFPTETEALRAFARDFPDRTTFLVDTYDTLEGVETAIAVIRGLGLSEGLGVRLDSGDLAELAIASRRRLDEAGLPQVRIFASGGLDEFEIERLVDARAPIDAFGVGTRMGVSADAPYLDSVYKLVEVEGRPVAKLSTGKATLPGRKQVFRGPGRADVLGLRDEAAPEGTEPLLQPVMTGGRRTAPMEPLTAARARFDADVADVSEAARRIRDPQPPVAERSEALVRLTREVTEELAGRD